MNKIEILTETIIQKDINFLEHKTRDISAAAIKMIDSKTIIFNENKFINSKEAYIALFHEYLHCEFDVFYNLDDSLQTRKRREYKIDKIMIQELVPIDKLKDLLNLELCNYELAEELDVSEEIIKIAFKIYKNMGVL